MVRVPHGYWTRYWITLVIFGLVIAFFATSSDWLLPAVRFHSGVFSVLIFTYLIFFTINLFLLRNPNYRNDYNFIAVKTPIYFPTLAPVLNKIFFPIMFGFPLVVGAIGHYEKLIVDQKFEVEEFRIVSSYFENRNKPSRKCYLLSNSSGTTSVCDTKQKFPESGTVKLKTYRGLISDYYDYANNP